MEYFVYVLQFEDGELYKGMTNCLNRRLEQHRNGLATWTKRKGNFKLFHTEIFSTRTEAMRREKFLKSGQGREFLKSLAK